MASYRQELMITLFLLVGLLISGCAKPTATSTIPTLSPSKTPEHTIIPTKTEKAGPYGDLIVATTGLGSERFDPIMESSDVAQMHLAPLFDFLLRGNGAEIVPSVIEKWELASDKLSWIFYVRKGIKFHNGEELTAEDVKFTIDRYALKEARNPDTRNMVDHVEVIDAYTVKIYTKGIQTLYPYIVYPATRTMGLVMPKDYFEANGAQYYERHPIASGPYKFVRYVPGDVIEYEAVDGHWRKTPAFKKLQWIKVPEESTRVALLKVGQVDITDVSIDSSSELQAPDFVTAGLVAEQVMILIPGAYQPEAARYPVSDIRIRKALSLSIDRDELIRIFFHDKASLPSPFPVFPNSIDIDIPYWNKYAATAYRYDPDEAKRLLKEAGYPSDFIMKLWVPLRPGAGYTPKMAEVIQGYWGKVGIKSEIQIVEQAVYVANRNCLKSSAWVGGGFTYTSSGGPFVAERLYGNFHSTGHTAPFGQAFPEFDKLIDAALTEMDPAKRKELDDKLIQFVTDSYVPVMIARVPAIVAYGTKVSFDFPQPPTPCHLGYYIETAKHVN